MTNNMSSSTMIKNKMMSDAWRETKDGDDNDDGSATVGSDVGFSIHWVITIHVFSYGAFKKYTNTSWY